MKSHRSRQIWMMIVSVLSIVCLVQSVILVIVFFSRPPSDSFFDSFDTYSSHLNQKFKNQTKDNFELFDRFFNDDFFSNNTDPFKEMDRQIPIPDHIKTEDAEILTEKDRVIITLPKG